MRGDWCKASYLEKCPVPNAIRIYDPKSDFPLEEVGFVRLIW